MSRWKEKGLLWFGMAFSITLVVSLSFLTLDFLVKREATQYGNLFLNQLRRVVSEVNQTVTHWLTPEQYAKLHRKPISHLQIWKTSEAQTMVEEVAESLRNPDGVFGFYTNCFLANEAECYDDLLFNGKNIVFRDNYKPRDRPWYAVSRGNSDWVVLSYLISKQAISGYPTAWALGFVRRFPVSMNESSPKKDQQEREDGIWVITSSPNPTAVSYDTEKIRSMSVLNMLLGETPTSFKNFDLSLKTLHFPVETLNPNFPLNPNCNSIISFKGFAYSANVQCWLNQEPVQFLFTKYYDHPIREILVLVVGLLLLVGVWRFFYKIVSQGEEIEHLRSQERIKLLQQKSHDFPRVESHDLLPISKEAYFEFVKEKYGGFPQMAKERGLDLNHIYRVNRKFKNEEYIVYKYDTIREIIGLNDIEACNKVVKGMLYFFKNSKS